MHISNSTNFKTLSKEDKEKYNKIIEKEEFKKVYLEYCSPGEYISKDYIALGIIVKPISYNENNRRVNGIVILKPDIKHRKDQYEYEELFYLGNHCKGIEDAMVLAYFR